VNDDWIDEVVDGKPKQAEYWQIDYIDNLLPRTSLTLPYQEEILYKIYQKDFSQLEAEEIIIYLKENEVYSDPRDQYKKMYKSGMFNDKKI
tara:strand:- start:3151 stop:3423 length:273 start_codon:yes stop_codon:yes gene_type:complete